MSDAPWEGRWALVPELSDFGEAPPPVRASWRFVREPTRVLVVAHWVGHDGEAHRLVSELPPDPDLHVDAEGHLHLHHPQFRAVCRRVRTDLKQVILYRRDLGMRKGKIAAQVAHAALGVFLERDRGAWQRLEVDMDPAMADWARAHCAKVVLSVETEADLLRAHRLATEAGLPTCLVTDAGRTEFHGVPTKTTCAIGPAPRDAVDAITGPDGAVRTKLA